jgi:hypothetical protein
VDRGKGYRDDGAAERFQQSDDDRGGLHGLGSG